VGRKISGACERRKPEHPGGRKGIIQAEKRRYNPDSLIFRKIDKFPLQGIIA
jgi:hypothetical protein